MSRRLRRYTGSPVGLNWPLAHRKHQVAVGLEAEVPAALLVLNSPVKIDWDDPAPPSRTPPNWWKATVLPS